MFHSHLLLISSAVPPPLPSSNLCLPVLYERWVNRRCSWETVLQLHLTVLQLHLTEPKRLHCQYFKGVLICSPKDPKDPSYLLSIEQYTVLYQTIREVKTGIEYFFSWVSKYKYIWKNYKCIDPILILDPILSKSVIPKVQNTMAQFEMWEISVAHPNL